CALVLGTGAAHRAAVRQLLAARADAAFCPGFQLCPVGLQRADRAVRRPFGGAVRAAGLLLAVPAAGAEHALRPAQGRGDHDARLAGVLFVGDHQRIGLRCYRQRRPCRRAGGRLHLRRHRRRNAADAGSGGGARAPGAKMWWRRFAPRAVVRQDPGAVGVPAPGAKMCWLRFAPRAVLLKERSRGRSTRPGCEYVLARFAPRAVLLQERSRGRSTRPGCEYVLARFTPRAVLLQERNRGRSTRPGCEYVLARFAPRAVLLQERSRGRSTRPGCEYVLAPVRTEGGAPTGASPL